MCRCRSKGDGAGGLWGLVAERRELPAEVPAAGKGVSRYGSGIGVSGSLFSRGGNCLSRPNTVSERKRLRVAMIDAMKKVPQTVMMVQYSVNRHMPSRCQSDHILPADASG